MNPKIKVCGTMFREKEFRGRLFVELCLIDQATGEAAEQGAVDGKIKPGVEELIGDSAHIAVLNDAAIIGLRRMMKFLEANYDLDRIESEVRSRDNWVEGNNPS